MPDERIEQISGGELTASADGDLLVILDVSDTTDSSAGTAKRIQVKNLSAYGEINVQENATETTISSSSSDFTNAVQVTVFDTIGNGGTFLNTTPSHTSDHITIGIAGAYYVNANLSFSGGSADDYSFAIFKNNKATQISARTARKLGTGGDLGAACCSGIYSLEVNDTVEVWIQNETVGANATISNATLSVFKVS